MLSSMHEKRKYWKYRFDIRPWLPSHLGYRLRSHAPMFTSASFKKYYKYINFLYTARKASQQATNLPQKRKTRFTLRA